MWFDGMYLVKEWKLNLKTVSEANCSQHWTKVAKRKKMQREIIGWKWLADPPRIRTPCTVKLIRIGSKPLDVGDNLPMAFKAVRDVIADYLLPGRAPGFADASPLITWEYDQKKGSPQGIIVQFYAVEPEIEGAIYNVNV